MVITLWHSLYITPPALVLVPPPDSSVNLTVPLWELQCKSKTSSAPLQRGGVAKRRRGVLHQGGRTTIKNIPCTASLPHREWNEKIYFTKFLFIYGRICGLPQVTPLAAALACDLGILVTGRTFTGAGACGRTLYNVHQ